MYGHKDIVLSTPIYGYNYILLCMGIRTFPSPLPPPPPVSRTHMEALGRFKYTQEAEDFELKKTLMCILTTLSVSDLAAIKVQSPDHHTNVLNPSSSRPPPYNQVLSTHKVLRHLLSFIVQNDKAGPEWNEAQFEELQLLVGGSTEREGEKVGLIVSCSIYLGRPFPACA